jgi:hypothetical protein
MAPLTTNARVYHRAGVTTSDIPATDIDEFIADAQAFIEGKAESTFSESDSNYNLARAACTDLAAAYALIRLLGGKYAGLEYQEPELDFDSQQHTKTVLIQQLIGQVNEALAVLARQTVPTLVPKASTD